MMYSSAWGSLLNCPVCIVLFLSSRKIITLWWDHCIWLSPSSLQWHVTCLFLRFLGSTAQGALLSVEDKEPRHHFRNRLTDLWGQVDSAMVSEGVHSGDRTAVQFVHVCVVICQQPFLLIYLSSTRTTKRLVRQCFMFQTILNRRQRNESMVSGLKKLMFTSYFQTSE